jgi:hypothetical protein
VRAYDLAESRASGAVAVVGDVGQFALERGGVASVNLRNGRLEEVRWQSFGKVERIIPRRGGVLVLVTADRVASFEPGQDDPVWSRDYTEAPMVCGLEEELVCIARPTGEVICVNAKTGVPVWGESVTGELCGLYSHDDRGSKLLVKIRQGANQFLSKLDASSGVVQWEFDAGPAGLFSVHDAGELVLVSTAASGTCAVLDTAD